MQIIDRQHPRCDEYLAELKQGSRLMSPFYQETNLAYYREYFQCTAEDASFCVAGKRPVLAFLMDAPTARMGQYGGQPTAVVFREDATEAEAIEAWKIAQNYLQKNFAEVEFQFEEINSETLSGFTQWLLNKGQSPRVLFRQHLNLEQSEESLLAKCRKIYRANIRKGQEALSVRLINHDTIETGDIEAFRQLHIRVAGKETRSKMSWSLQEEMIRQSEAFALYGYLNNELVAAGLFPHTRYRCYYGVGAYDRTLFDQPLSHGLVWSAVMQAKKQGCQWFDLGDIFFSHMVKADGTLPTEKELSISHFKSGFGGALVSVLRF